MCRDMLKKQLCIAHKTGGEAPELASGLAYLLTRGLCQPGAEACMTLPLQ